MTCHANTEVHFWGILWVKSTYWPKNSFLCIKIFKSLYIQQPIFTSFQVSTEYVKESHLDQWQKDYIKMKVPDMFPILIAANFLEIKGLIGKSIF